MAFVKKIVGLKYEEGKGAPKIILKGSGNAVNDILKERYLLNGPPIVKNPDLLEKLYRLPTDSEITKDLYELVAVLLVHVYEIDKKIGEDTNE